MQDTLQKQKDGYDELQKQKGASDALAESAAKSVREIKAQVRESRIRSVWKKAPVEVGWCVLCLADAREGGAAGRGLAGSGQVVL